ncbi:MAG: nucleotidyltransferase domain-containing protein [bacterium]|nr:nucleotidyltransferase domain-containing protein [bacterium]
MSTRLTNLSAQVLPILQKHSVRRASLFGSVLRDDFNQGTSDVDFLVEFSDDRSLFDQLRLQIDLEKELQRSVDVVEYDSLKKRIKNDILDSAVSIL